jgi:predicted nucleic-acid-binding protein
MIAVDTNVIVRFLIYDDEVQARKATTLFKTQEIYIPDTVILETEWVLRYAYHFTAEEICTTFLKLFGLKNVHLSNPAWVAQAIQWHQQGLDFADALHLVQTQSCTKLLSFDAKFVNKAKGLSAYKVTAP